MLFLFHEFWPGKIGESMLGYDYLAILGPTATGKTAAALALAEHYPIEIISVDSVSVYKPLNIGSAKPSKEELSSVKHHLIDICDLDTVFTVGKFIEASNLLIKDIRSRGKIPVFCGGSLMYMKALQSDHHSLPVVEHELQSSLIEMLNNKGIEYMYALLKKEDPMMASKVHANDSQRIIRALGVIRQTGKSLCAYWQQQQRNRLNGLDIFIHVNDRDAHRAIIRERIDIMFENGFEQECHDILTRYGLDIIKHPAMKSIGYKEICESICKQNNTNNVREKITISTSQFVKRQTTWLKSWANSQSRVFELYDENSQQIKVIDRIVESL